MSHVRVKAKQMAGLNKYFASASLRAVTSADKPYLRSNFVRLCFSHFELATIANQSSDMDRKEW